VGTIVIRNLSFEKQVVVRYTVDNWVSTTDVVAQFVGTISTTSGGFVGVDRFTFSLRLTEGVLWQAALKSLASSSKKSGPERGGARGVVDDDDDDDDATPDANQRKKPCPTVRLEFALMAFMNGTEHWDNNDSKNHCVLLRKEPKPLVLPSPEATAFALQVAKASALAMAAEAQEIEREFKADRMLMESHRKRMQDMQQQQQRDSGRYHQRNMLYIPGRLSDPPRYYGDFNGGGGDAHVHVQPLPSVLNSSPMYSSSIGPRSVFSSPEDHRVLKDGQPQESTLSSGIYVSPEKRSMSPLNNHHPQPQSPRPFTLTKRVSSEISLAGQAHNLDHYNKSNHQQQQQQQQQQPISAYPYQNQQQDPSNFGSYLRHNNYHPMQPLSLQKSSQQQQQQPHTSPSLSTPLDNIPSSPGSPNYNFNSYQQSLQTTTTTNKNRNQWQAASVTGLPLPPSGAPLRPMTPNTSNNNNNNSARESYSPSPSLPFSSSYYNHSNYYNDHHKRTRALSLDSAVVLGVPANNAGNEGNLNTTSPSRPGSALSGSLQSCSSSSPSSSSSSSYLNDGGSSYYPGISNIGGSGGYLYGGGGYYNNVSSSGPSYSGYYNHPSLNNGMFGGGGLTAPVSGSPPSPFGASALASSFLSGGGGGAGFAGYHSGMYMQQQQQSVSTATSSSPSPSPSFSTTPSANASSYLSLANTTTQGLGISSSRSLSASSSSSSTSTSSAVSASLSMSMSYLSSSPSNSDPPAPRAKSPIAQIYHNPSNFRPSAQQQQQSQQSQPTLPSLQYSGASCGGSGHHHAYGGVGSGGGQGGDYRCVYYNNQHMGHFYPSVGLLLTPEQEKEEFETTASTTTAYHPEPKRPATPAPAPTPSTLQPGAPNPRLTLYAEYLQYKAKEMKERAVGNESMEQDDEDMLQSPPTSPRLEFQITTSTTMAYHPEPKRPATPAPAPAPSTLQPGAPNPRLTLYAEYLQYKAKEMKERAVGNESMEQDDEDMLQSPPTSPPLGPVAGGAGEEASIMSFLTRKPKLFQLQKSSAASGYAST
jgi:hypothetical protein